MYIKFGRGTSCKFPVILKTDDDDTRGCWVVINLNEPTEDPILGDHQLHKLSSLPLNHVDKLTTQIELEA